jgi:hypothetical protein
MTDNTEGMRRLLVGVINCSLPDDEQARLNELANQYGDDNVWDTAGVERDFEILGFLAPFVAARRKSDNKRGSLMFCHHPRFYFNFEPTG